MPKTDRTAHVICKKCGFRTRRALRHDGGYGSCSDCGADLCHVRAWQEYVSSGAAKDHMHEVNAVRLLMELHDPRRKIRSHQRTRQTTIKRYGRSFYQQIGSMPKTRKKRCKRKRNS